MKKGKTTICYRIIKWLVRLVYPKMEAVGAENIPDEPVILVGNHSQLHGPIACELYMPVERYTWCAGEMMHWSDVADYAYRDFWSGKPKASRWLYKLLSYLITPVSVCIFNNAQTIGVYRDSRILSTFKKTVKCLQSSTSVVIFPECDAPHNQILYAFQENFVEVARLYYKRTGKALAFVPMYIAPKLRQLHFGEPIRFDPGAPMEQERHRICVELMDAVTKLAVALPRHRVVPYRNLPKNKYPFNKGEKLSHEKTDG